jgi:protein-S-isoprenylcysteine O-methyltransferase Ste14
MLLRRHLQAIAALPFVVTVVIPVWLARRNRISIGLGHGWQALLAQSAGLVLLGIGVWMFIKTVRQFGSEGRGTLAPWDPPRQLVINGLYRYVRNPMISGVCFILLARACCCGPIPTSGGRCSSS